MKQQSILVRSILFGSVVVLGLALALPAHAQFICAGSADGTTGLSGQAATATGSTDNVACGINANASGIGANNAAFGPQANASGNNSANTATGFAANASGTGISANVATGAQSDAHGDGSFNTATGFASIAKGNASVNIATGWLADASGDGGRNIAIGDHATARGTNSRNTAVGSNSLATGNNSSAFGAGAQAAFINSAAFGVGAVVTRANQQVFGTATNTYTLPGITSAASNAAQSGATQVVTTDAAGNLGTTPISGLVTSGASGAAGAAFDPTALNLNVNQLNRRMNRAFTGVAMAFAMAGVPTVLPNEKFVFTADWGTYQGANGAALSGAFRIYRNVQLNASFGYGFRESMAGGRAGLRFGF